MGLRLKFNLVLLLVFALGLGVTGYISYDLLHRNARDEVLRNAGVMMEAALSMRGYTVGAGAPAAALQRGQVPAAERAGVSRATEIMNRCARSTPTTPTRKRRSIPPTRATARWSGRPTSSTRSATTRRAARSAACARRPPGARCTSRGRSRSRTRPASPATRRPPRRRPRWSRSTARTTASAGSTWR